LHSLISLEKPRKGKKKKLKKIKKKFKKKKESRTDIAANNGTTSLRKPFAKEIMQERRKRNRRQDKTSP